MSEVIAELSRAVETLQIQVAELRARNACLSSTISVATGACILAPHEDAGVSSLTLYGNATASA